MGLGKNNVFLPPNSTSQINALKNYLTQSKSKKLMLAGKDALNNKEAKFRPRIPLLKINS